MENVLKIGVKTTVPSYHVSFEWEFENFSKLPSKWEKKSQEFSVQPGSSWYVRFRKGPHIWLYLSRTNGENLRASCETLILNCKNEALHETQCDYQTSGEVDLLPCIDFNNKLKNLPEDRVTFKILIKIDNTEPSTVYKNQPSSAAKVSLNRLTTLSGDFKKLFNKDFKTDVTFNIGGETLSAHKAILVARSSVFARMFQEGMTEEDNSVVDIEDIDLTTMKSLLSFVYSAELEEEGDVDTVLELYRAADKYAVTDLKDACADTLASKMTTENACKILYIADMHHHLELKEKAIQFLAAHHKPSATEHQEKS